MAKEDRRKFLKAGVAGAAGVAAAAVPAKAATDKPTKQVIWNDKGTKPEKPQRFSPVVTFGDLVFLSGIGAHFKGDIKSHTEHVLKELEAKLKMAGSSMEKVLKVNVYLNDIKDYDAMNEVYIGKFGPEPGVRTTIAAAGGIPGNSLVEIDCIACK
jgi:enamine deaminase RidA (YjgF/YER057c/UK114 family)